MDRLTSGERASRRSDRQEWIPKQDHSQPYPGPRPHHDLTRKTPYKSTVRRYRQKSSRLTSQNQLEFAFPTTNTIVDPTMRPANESPNARSRRHAGPSLVYGRNLEFAGGSVLQKAAIVVRSKPPYENPGGFRHVENR